MAMILIFTHDSHILIISIEYNKFLHGNSKSKNMEPIYTLTYSGHIFPNNLQIQQKWSESTNSISS